MERTRASPLGGPESQLDQGSKSISDVGSIVECEHAQTAPNPYLLRATVIRGPLCKPAYVAF